MKTVSDVVCPDCDARPNQPCVYANSPAGRRPHEARFTLARGYAALGIKCRTCDALPGTLCRDLRTRKDRPRYNVGPHYFRDEDAWKAGLSKPVRGLRYKDGTVVREGWISADGTRKRDGLRSVHVRPVGGAVAMFWASTYDNRIWSADTYKKPSQETAKRRWLSSPVDRLGDLARRATTFWSG